MKSGSFFSLGITMPFEARAWRQVMAGRPQLVKALHWKCLRQRLHGWEHELELRGAFAAELSPGAPREAVSKGVISLIWGRPELVKGLCALRNLPLRDLIAPRQTCRRNEEPMVELSKTLLSQASPCDAASAARAAEQPNEAGDAHSGAPQAAEGEVLVYRPREAVENSAPGMLEKCQSVLSALGRENARRDIFREDMRPEAWAEPKLLALYAWPLATFAQRAEHAVSELIGNKPKEDVARQPLNQLPWLSSACKIKEGGLAKLAGM